jgi:hypothetical protein
VRRQSCPACGGLRSALLTPQPALRHRGSGAADDQGSDEGGGLRHLVVLDVADHKAGAADGGERVGVAMSAVPDARLEAILQAGYV